MSMDNLISIDITPEDNEKIIAALKALEETLRPYLVTLTPDERRELPKMGDKTLPFVRKVFDYVESNQEFAPAFVEVAELKKDVTAVEKLTQFYRLLTQLIEGLNDSIMLAGSEAYVTALAYYNSVKQASKMNIPAAEPIYADLRTRFPRGRRSTETTEE